MRKLRWDGGSPKYTAQVPLCCSFSGLLVSLPLAQRWAHMWPPTPGPQARLSQEPPCCVPLGWQHQGGPELPLSQGPSHRYLRALSPNAPSLGSSLLEVGSTVRGFLLLVFLFLFVVSFIVSHLRTPSRRENSFPKIIVTADYVSLPCPSI